MRRFMPLLVSVCILPFSVPDMVWAQSLKISPFPLGEAEPLVAEAAKADNKEWASNTLSVNDYAQAPAQVSVTIAPKAVAAGVPVTPRYSADEFRDMALKQLNYEPPRPVVVEVEPPEPVALVEPEFVPVVVQAAPKLAPPVIAFVESEAPEPIVVERPRPAPIRPSVSPAPTIEVVEPLEGDPYTVYQARITAEQGDVLMPAPEARVRVVPAEEKVAVAPVLDADMKAVAQTDDFIAFAKPEIVVPKIRRYEAPETPRIIKLDAAQPKWSARTGNTLRSVLQLWSEQAGVEFVWQSNRNYRIVADYDSGEGYSQAVGELLDVYIGQEMRPIGHLQIDPESDRKRLTIVTASGS